MSPAATTSLVIGGTLLVAWPLALRKTGWPYWQAFLLSLIPMCPVLVVLSIAVYLAVRPS